MFRWYAQANICYAYLADVPVGFGIIPDLGDGHALSKKEEHELMNSAFSQSRWFTKGWTLQELIAPAEVKFYNSSFGFMGSKRTLTYLISRITSIDETLLLGERPVNSFCVARKMSWPAKRVTTRKEDMAYSLLGLFDVSMPLLYGEGGRAYLHSKKRLSKLRMTSPSSPGKMSPTKSCTGTGRTNVANEPFRMTNRGLSLRLPLVEAMGGHGEPQNRAVLGCRYEDDLSGPIVLNLERMTPSGGYPLAHTGPKLSVVPLADIDTAKYKSVSILERYDPSAAFERAPPIQGNQKCWIKFLNNNRGFNMIEAHPQRFWNMTTGVFIPPRGSNVAGGVHFLSQDGMEFVLTFGYLRVGAPFYNEWIMLVEPDEDRTLEQISIRSSIENVGGTRVRMQLEGMRKLRIEASITTETVMDETVFVISIRLEPEYFFLSCETKVFDPPLNETK